MTAATLAVVLPLAAATLYLLLGNPDGLHAPAPRHQITANEVERMVASLAARLDQEPDNMEGWVMLARSYRTLSRPNEAEGAFDHAAASLDGNAELLAEYADTVTFNAKGQFTTKSMMLIDKALKADPNHPMALWLAGTAAFRNNDFDRAVAVWTHMQEFLPPGSTTRARFGPPSPTPLPTAAKLSPSPVATSPHRGRPICRQRIRPGR